MYTVAMYLLNKHNLVNLSFYLTTNRTSYVNKRPCLVNKNCCVINMMLVYYIKRSYVVTEYRCMDTIRDGNTIL